MSEATCSSLLEALIPIGDTLLSMTGSEAACIGAKLSDVIHTASILASADQGKGHSLLCKAAIGWLQTWYVLVVHVIKLTYCAGMKECVIWK